MLNLTLLGEGKKFRPAVVMRCLNSIPFNKTNSLAFINYIVPMINMQSTLAYLKKPPPEYMLPAVDIEGGIAEIREHIEAGKFKKQYQFESDMHWLINVAPHDAHLRVPLPLVSAFGFGTELELSSLSKDGISVPEVYMKDDLKANPKNATPIVSISGEIVSDYIERSSQSLMFHDPDALYNAMFCILPLGKRCGGQIGFGFSRHLADTEVVQFQDGTTKKVKNFGVLLNEDLLDFQNAERKGLEKRLDHVSAQVSYVLWTINFYCTE
jgi:hypothetical protein